VYASARRSTLQGARVYLSTLYIALYAIQLLARLKYFDFFLANCRYHTTVKIVRTLLHRCSPFLSSNVARQISSDIVHCVSYIRVRFRNVVHSHFSARFVLAQHHDRVTPAYYFLTI